MGQFYLGVEVRSSADVGGREVHPKKSVSYTAQWKHCTKCHRQYDDPSLKFCTEDSTPLTQFDPEAETVKIPELSKADIEMEIADYLRRNFQTYEPTLIKFEPLTGLGTTTQRISECFETAARQGWV